MQPIIKHIMVQHTRCKITWFRFHFVTLNDYVNPGWHFAYLFLERNSNFHTYTPPKLIENIVLQVHKNDLFVKHFWFLIKQHVQILCWTMLVKLQFDRECFFNQSVLLIFFPGSSHCKTYWADILILWANIRCGQCAAICCCIVINWQQVNEFTWLNKAKENFSTFWSPNDTQGLLWVWHHCSSLLITVPMFSIDILK